jgi:hypothetical protein
MLLPDREQWDWIISVKFYVVVVGDNPKWLSIVRRYKGIMVYISEPNFEWEMLRQVDWEGNYWQAGLKTISKIIVNKDFP